MRLGFNWPLGPLEHHRADRPGARGRAARARCEREKGEAYRRPRACCAAGAAEDRVSARRKPASEHTARRNREAAASLPPDDAADFAEARRGLVAPLRPAPGRGRRARRSGTWSPTTSSTRDARHRQPEPLAPEPAQPHRRPLRAGAGLLPAARLRPLEHARGRGRRGHRRDRPAGLRRDRRRRARPLPRAPRRAPGHRPRSTPTATSTTSAAPGHRLRRGGRGARHPGARPGGLPPPRGQRERLRRHGDGPPRRLHVRGAARARPRRPGRLRPRADHLAGHADADPAQPSRSPRPARRRPSTGCGCASSSPRAPRRRRR